MSATSRTPARRAIGDAIALAGSVGVHVGLIAYVMVYATVPDVDIDFSLPDEVEFGVTEGMTVTDEPLAAATEPTPPPEEVAVDPAEGSDDEGEEETAPDAGRLRPDAGRASEPPDAGVPQDAGDTGEDLVASAGTSDAGVPDGGLAGLGTGRHRELPPGAQLALRMDMERIRQSPLAPDVRALLQNIPEWQRLLDGSGIDPLDDLDRVLIASPNLDPDRVVVAGRYDPEHVDVREVVVRMARAHGESPPGWRRAQGVDVAPWPDLDDVERVVALVGPRHFAICRDEDLPRVLALSQIRAQHEDREEHPADALLSMPNGAGITVEVEGARRFARGARGVPSQLSLVVTELPDGTAQARAFGTYDDEAQARDARDFWDRARAQFAGSFLVRISGMSSALTNAELRAEGNQVHGRTQMSARQIRMVLGQLTSALRDRARRRAAPEPDGRPPPPVP